MAAEDVSTEPAASAASTLMSTSPHHPHTTAVGRKMVSAPNVPTASRRASPRAGRPSENVWSRDST